LRPEEVPVRVPPSQLRKLHLSIRAALPALDPREGVQS
jgi:hypothetical protein